MVVHLQVLQLEGNAVVGSSGVDSSKSKAAPGKVCGNCVSHSSLIKLCIELEGRLKATMQANLQATDQHILLLQLLHTLRD